MKGKVDAAPQGRVSQQGRPYYRVGIDGKDYFFWDKEWVSVLTVGAEVEFDLRKKDDGTESNAISVLNGQKAQGAGSGKPTAGRSWQPRPPEEIALNCMTAMGSALIQKGAPTEPGVFWKWFDEGYGHLVALLNKEKKPNP